MLCSQIELGEGALGPNVCKHGENKDAECKDTF